MKTGQAVPVGGGRVADPAQLVHRQRRGVALLGQGVKLNINTESGSG